METSVWPPVYSIRRSKRAKRIHLSINAKRGLELVLPMRASEKTGIKFLDAHRDWIEKHYSKIELRKPKAVELPELIYFSGLDQTWTVTYLPGVRTTLKANDQLRMLMIKGDRARPDLITAVLKRWLNNFADAVLADWLFEVSDKIKLPFKNCNIRQQSSIWGSCSHDNQISLNAKLLFLPSECVEYVLIHELCHTVHHNHSKQFWNLVEKHMPEFRDAKKELKRADELTPGWVSG